LKIQPTQYFIVFLQESITGISNKNDDILPTGEKTILLWTTFFRWEDFRFGLGREPFVAAGCRYTNCMTTTDKSLVNQSDALIFHPNDFKPTDLPQWRLANQRYVFLYYEVIATERERLYIFSHQSKGYFNWTMTHRRDSDILSTHPYGFIRRKWSSMNDIFLPKPLPMDEDPPDPRSFFENSLNPKVEKKAKQVAWFNSNCVTLSGRENYFYEMGQYMRIDIYGACGNMKCSPANGSNCDELFHDYKFYIAAEDSICADYVTEQFYRALLSDVIPIVYGGADYSAYAPPHSYINAADFVSPKALAEYIYLLDTNPVLYSKYFDWKKGWEVIHNPTNGWCDLCEKLNNPEQPSKSYQDIGKWYYDKVPCLPGISLKKLYGEH
jgi:alpha-1,3-fucosyltransferase